MKERSLILRLEEVRAILDGRQTRISRPIDFTKIPLGLASYAQPVDKQGIRGAMTYCPLGEPGDRLVCRASRLTLEVRKVWVDRWNAACSEKGAAWETNPWRWVADVEVIK